MRILTIFFLCYSLLASAQDDILAREYVKKGEFKKALIQYKKLYRTNPDNDRYLLELAKIHQQLEQLDQSEILLEGQIARREYPPLYVELGYNYQLKNDTLNSKLNYQKAQDIVNQKPIYGSLIGQAFEKRSLLDQAVIAYKKAMQLNPDLNFNMALARIYGEQGKIDKMFSSYIDLAEKNTAYLNHIKRNISDFISDDALNENNVKLRKTLLKKIQQKPNLLWNEMLSWLFIQQKDYNKAFTQEKAIYTRKPESFHRIEELAKITVDSKDIDTAKAIYEYIIEKSQNITSILKANKELLRLKIKTSDKKDYESIANTYQSLFNEYDYNGQTLDLQIDYAHFLAFNDNNPKKATEILKNALQLKLSPFQKAKIKLELGDILVLQERFNEALIYYTQIQKRLKNSTISQQARYKVAKTSYYKGDLKWAESQLKILKASASQLTANDALDLKLIISDNKYGDSLQTALKLYAKADLLSFQNKKDKAIEVLSTILNDHKTETIVTQALLKQGMLLEEKQQYEQASKNYQRLIKDFPEHILIDEAYYRLANINDKHLANLEEAKRLYEHLIFNHEDSIYYIEARKRYRQLRGDDIN